MLQLDRHRHLAMNGSRMVRGSHSKPPTNFLSRNKRAIRDKSRSQAASRDVSKEEPPRSKKLQERQLQQRVKSETTVSRDDRGVGPTQSTMEGGGMDTVVISKNYLQELLRMSMVRGETTADGDTKSHENAGKHGNRETVVNVEPAQIPGLDIKSLKHITSPPTQPIQQTGHAHYSSQTNSQGLNPHTNNNELTPHEKWLQDLSAQVEEQKAQKERKRLMEQQSAVEEYFPFGRPGGGAPITSQSGQLLTDYRSRTRYHDQVDRPSRGHFREKTQANNVQVQGEPFVSMRKVDVERTNVNHVPAHDGPISTEAVGSVMMSPLHHGTAELHSTTPRFARGAGPHVDQYMLQEMNEKRRKQMEHMELVRQQVLEKERAKMEEKLRKEREDAIGEAKLAAERERMRQDFEREKEKAMRKEIEAQQRQALLQERILEAEESARLAKLEAKGLTARHTVAGFNDDAIMRSPGGKVISEGVFSSLSKSELRSPSMLQLASSSMDVDYTGNTNAPLTHRGQGNGKTVGVASGKQSGETDVMKKRNSRIPVIREPQRTSKSKVVVGSRVQHTSKLETNARKSRVANQRTRETNGGRSVHAAITGRRQTIEPSVSPPVPVVSKRLKEQASIVHRKSDSLHTHNKPSPHDDSGTSVRSYSPPVPAVVKKLRNGEFKVEDHMTVMPHLSDYRAMSPPVPAVAKQLRDERWGQTHATMATETVVESSQRALSPPVPTVAKRLKNETNIQDHATSAQDIHSTENLHVHVAKRALSPPVPALAKKLNQGKNEHKLGVIDEESKTHSSVETTKSAVNMNSDANICTGERFSSIADTYDVQLLINRPPSCKPDSKPLSPVTMTTSSFPVITMTTTGDDIPAVVRPQSTNRQRLILQQLTMLKEGILTQQNSIDHRVQTILNRNKQCTF